MTDSRAKQFERDGYIVVKGLYSVQEIEEWKERILTIMKKRGEEDTPSGVSVWMVEDLDPYFKEKMSDPGVVDVLRELIGPDIEFLSVKPVFKNNTTVFDSPWHQDWAYWEGSHKLSVWIALDKATRTNGCLKIIPGSHKIFLETKSVNDETGFNRRTHEASLEGLPVEVLEVDPGDSVFFHDLIAHASFPNTDGSDRWSFISTYRDGSVQDDSTVWKTSIIVGKEDRGLS